METNDNGFSSFVCIYYNTYLDRALDSIQMGYKT